MFTLFKKPKMANFGCGVTLHTDWDNFDLNPVQKNVKKIDLSKKLPFKDAHYDYCYCSHVLEHLNPYAVRKFLKELYRVTKTGGIVRIVVPDLEAVCRRYIQEIDKIDKGETENYAEHEWLTIELLDQLTRTFPGGFMGRLWSSRPLLAEKIIIERCGYEALNYIKQLNEQFKNGTNKPIHPEQVFDVPDPSEEAQVNFRRTGEVHRWMYDRISLKNLLVKTGFQNVTQCQSNTSQIPNFVSFNLDTDEQSQTRKPDSLFMEAIR